MLQFRSKLLRFQQLRLLVREPRVLVRGRALNEQNPNMLLNRTAINKLIFNDKYQTKDQSVNRTLKNKRTNI